MAYTKPTISSGDTLDQQFLEDLLQEFRKELVLTNSQLDNATITADNIRRPSFRAIGMNAYEWRGVSGGVKYIKNDPANLSSVEDNRTLNRPCAFFSRDPTGAAVVTLFHNAKNPYHNKSLGQPANNPTNSAVSRRQYSEPQTRFLENPELAPVLPGSSLSVVFDKEAIVHVRAKAILNWLPTPIAGNGDHVDSKAMKQHMALGYQKPDGTVGLFSGGAKSYAFRCQSEWDFRDNYFSSNIVVDEDNLGEWSFFVLVAFTYFTSQDVKYHTTQVALPGASMFEVEWYNTQT